MNSKNENALFMQGQSASNSERGLTCDALGNRIVMMIGCTGIRSERARRVERPLRGWCSPRSPERCAPRDGRFRRSPRELWKKANSSERNENGKDFSVGGIVRGAFGLLFDVGRKIALVTRHIIVRKAVAGELWESDTLPNIRSLWTFTWVRTVWILQLLLISFFSFSAEFVTNCISQWELSGGTGNTCSKCLI